MERFNIKYSILRALPVNVFAMKPTWYLGELLFAGPLLIKDYRLVVTERCRDYVFNLALITHTEHTYTHII